MHWSLFIILSILNWRFSVRDFPFKRTFYKRVHCCLLIYCYCQFSVNNSIWSFGKCFRHRKIHCISLNNLKVALSSGLNNKLIWGHFFFSFFVNIHLGAFSNASYCKSFVFFFLALKSNFLFRLEEWKYLPMRIIIYGKH